MAVLVLGAGLTSCLADKTEKQPPNIVFILSDDTGYSDIGCFGSEINTPNIDKLGYDGIRFSSFYSGAKCEPSRSSIFTGLYQGGSRAVNFVQILREKGYYTIQVGKEHFRNWVPESAYAARVNDQSLTYWAITEYFEPPSGFMRPFVLNGKEVDADQIYHEKKPFHKEDALTDNAVLSPPTSNANKFRPPRGEEGNQERRAKIPLYRPWDDLSDAEKDEMDLEMAVYAAMMDNLDQNIGRVLQKIEDAGLSDNTLIIYLSDNGACPYDSNRNFDFPPGHPDGFRSQTAAWSNACNTPFRYFKQFGHEGGARVHALMWWPSTIQAGSISHQPAHMVDLYPTILEATGIEYPEKINGYQPQKLQGSSLMPVMLGQKREDPPFFISGVGEGFKMYRKGDWKIVKKNHEDWELYNLKEDPTENIDLSEAKADKVAEMESHYKAAQTRFRKESE